MRILLITLTSIFVFSLWSCNSNQQVSTDEKVNLVVADSIVFTWYAPQEWHYYSTYVGEKVASIIANPSLHSFKLSDGKTTYTVAKKDFFQEDIDYKEWKFRCMNLSDETHCFYFSNGGFYPKPPPQYDYQEHELQFTLYLVE